MKGAIPTRFRLAIAGLVLAAHVALLIDGAVRDFIVVDEAGHVPSGIAHWRTGRFDAYCVNPPLPRMIATLPALALDPVLIFRKSEVSPGERPEWQLALDFPGANRRDFLLIFRLSRVAGIVWSILGAILIGRWAQDLFGDAAGLLGMALWCFEPTVMAFARLVVPDVPAAVAGLAAAYGFWNYLRFPAAPRALLVGLLLGIAELTKLTHLLLYPLWGVAWTIFRPGGGIARPKVAHAGIALLVSLLIINFGYGFRGTGRRLGEFGFFSRALSGADVPAAGSEGNRFRGQALGGVPVPLPEDYVRGIDFQCRDFEAGFPSYLAGQWRRHGWWYYYLYAAGIKVPIGTLVLVAWGLVGSIGRRCMLASGEAFLLLHGVAFFALVSSRTGFNHHFRYVLPAFPFLILVACGTARSVGSCLSARTTLVAALAAWSIGAGLGNHPHSLSYFNEVVGGPEHGDEYLVDSNIDWGQDLLYLKVWLDAHSEARPLGLAYYNLIDPRVVGIEFGLPPLGPNGIFPDDRRYQSRMGPHPGYFAISVNHLRGAEFAAPDGDGGLRITHRGDFEYFRLFQPIAEAGRSIRIFHLTPADAASARLRLGIPPLEN